MFLDWLLNFFTLLQIFNTHPPAHIPQATIGELLSYECARNVANAVQANEQIGPLFVKGSLIFTSIEAMDRSKILLLDAGYGLYALPLPSDNINRIRFSIPKSANQTSRAFYLSYLHGDRMRSRYFDFSEGRPPLNFDETDFAFETPVRSDALLPQLDYAIFQTLQLTVSAVQSGRIPRDQVIAPTIESCQHMARQDALRFKTIASNIETLNALASPPPKLSLGMTIGEREPTAGGREPASSDTSTIRLWQSSNSPPVAARSGAMAALVPGRVKIIFAPPPH